MCTSSLLFLWAVGLVDTEISAEQHFQLLNWLHSKITQEDVGPRKDCSRHDY